MLAAADGSNGDEIIRRIQASPELPPPMPPDKLGKPDVLADFLREGNAAAAPAAKPDVLADFKREMPTADVSDPAGNMDVRDIRATPEYDRTKDQALNKPPWYRSNMFLQGTGYQTPRQEASTRRGAVIGALGSVGDFANKPVEWLDMAGVHVPRAPIPGLYNVGIPGSKDIDEGLSALGWKPDTAYPDEQDRGAIAGSFLMPGGAAKNVPSGISSLGKTGRLVEAASGGVKDAMEARGIRAPDSAPFPSVDVVSPAPPLPVPKRVAPNALNAELEGHIAANETRLQAAKQAAYKGYETGVKAEGEAGATLDLTDLKKDLNDRLSKTKNKDLKNSVRTLRDEVEDLDADTKLTHAEKFEQLDQIRRRVRAAGKGVNATGYDALKGGVADKLTVDIGVPMKKASPAYDKYTGEYHDLSKESEPLDRTFLKGAGEKEGMVQMRAALQNPKNVESSIAAMGPGGAAKFDALAAKHVQNELAGKTGAALEKAYTDMGPSLEKLPQARATAERMFNRAQRQETLEGIVQRAQSLHLDQTKDAISARQFAGKYEPMLAHLQNADLSRRPAALHSAIQQMQADGLISPAEYAAFDKQIATAQQAVDKSKAFQTLSKYLIYSISGNYMLSFGGPHLVEYLAR
jgi:hypothetical protein